MAAVCVLAAVESGRPVKAVAAQDGRTAPMQAAVQQAAGAGYVGSAACAKCHLDEYKSFTKTRMGRSLVAATPEVFEGLSLPDTLASTALDRHFETFAKDGKLFQSEFQLDENGGQVFRNTKQVDWIIGAGQNGFGTLVNRDDFLFEGPLSFYAKPKKWELSPGFENADSGFNRPIPAGCLFCHSGRPIPMNQETGKLNASSAISPIGCENCHGPGAAHIVKYTTKKSPLQGTQIVNPDRLTASLENDLCMSCHEDGDSRVLRPGKSYRDFLPGHALDETMSILMAPRKRDMPDDSDHVQHFYAMSMSKCYRESKGELRCATCHDPHVEPTSQEAPGYFNQKCVTCHQAPKQTCTLALSERRKTEPADNCIGCHMPKRGAQEFAHSSLTNHRILARPGEPWPEAAYQQTTPELPDLVHLNRLAGRRDDLPPLTLLEAYGTMAASKPEYEASYERVLSELEKTDPNHAAVQLGLGRRDLKAKAFDEAAKHFELSLQLNPQQALAEGYLSDALAGSGRYGEAIAASDKAIALDPFNTQLRRTLIDRLIAAQQYDRAKTAMEDYLRDFPEDSFMRRMLTIANQ